jgi:hypothetical protein
VLSRVRERANTARRKRTCSRKIEFKDRESEESGEVDEKEVWIKKTTRCHFFVFFISLLLVAQHVSGNHVPIIRS